MADGTVKQKIKICYKFIGFVDELHITPTKRWTALPAKHCTVCGVEYVPGSAISKYCPVCARKVRLERSNESRRRSREQKRMVCIESSAKNDRLVSHYRCNESVSRPFCLPLDAAPSCAWDVWKEGCDYYAMLRCRSKICGEGHQTQFILVGNF